MCPTVNEAKKKHKIGQLKNSKKKNLKGHKYYKKTKDKESQKSNNVNNNSNININNNSNGPAIDKTTTEEIPLPSNESVLTDFGFGDNLSFK